MPRFETGEQTYASVSALSSAIKQTVQSLGGGVVEAEIRSLHRAGSGHCYLTLADAESEISAVMWKGTVARQGELPAEGDLVTAHFDKVDFYPARGSLQIILSSLEPTGEGELLARRAKTLARLSAEGLTNPDRKPPLARFPKKIGVIAGKDSDAMHDVIRAVQGRSRSAPIVFCPALVQGVDSPMSVIAAIAALCQTPEVETIILARGGGSVTDLSAFDDEALCRAVFASPVPVITSIGHTKDRPVCDHVSAAYAPVPAKAAELAIALSDEGLLRELDDVIAPALRRVREQFEVPRNELAQLGDELLVRSTRMLSLGRERIASAGAQLVDRGRAAILLRRSQVAHQLELLAASDLPGRGAIFALTESGEPVRSAQQLAPGQRIGLGFVDGHADATIEEIKTREDPQ